MLDFNTLRPRQNGRLFADDIFKRILLNETIRISTQNSLKFIPKGLINNNPALVQIMAWRRPGDKPLFEPIMVTLLTHICVTRPQWVNPLWSSEAMWWHRSASAFSQLLAFCLMAPNNTWIDANLSKVKSSDIHPMAISHELPQPSITISS